MADDENKELAANVSAVAASIVPTPQHAHLARVPAGGFDAGLAALPEKVVGFVPFFIATALAGLPALLLLVLVYRNQVRRALAQAA